MTKSSQIKPSKEQKVILNTKGNVMVIANPGTGKTTTLAFKVIDLLKSGVEPEEILCITFTAKAKKEMFDSIFDLAQGKIQDSVIMKIPIHTFHSYAYDYLTGAGLIPENIAGNNLLRYSILESLDSNKALNYPKDHIIGRLLGKIENSIRYIKNFGLIPKNIDLNKTEIKTIEKKTINLYSHTRIYFTAIESWKNRLVLGNGHKSFRIICKNILQKKKNLACSTHPHNYHLEILHDYGLIGFVIILIFTLIKLYQLSRSYFSNNNNEKFKLFFLPISILFLIEIWPIKSTGMLLTTWNGTIVWLIISLTSIYTLSKKN